MISMFLISQEGRGRKDRKLAVAFHRRRNGKSIFRVAQNVKGLLCSSDESYVGSMTANLLGSKYYIWDKVGISTSMYQHWFCL